MKTCIECGESKPYTEYGRRSVADDGLNPRCRPCRQGYERRHYASRVDAERARRRSDVARYQTRNQAIISQHLATHPCVDCGEGDPIVLEFDHVRGTKVANISRLRLQGSSEQALLEEIGKCEVRCANCHRRVTHARAARASKNSDTSSIDRRRRAGGSEATIFLP